MEVCAQIRPQEIRPQVRPDRLAMLDQLAIIGNLRFLIISYLYRMNLATEQTLTPGFLGAETKVGKSRYCAHHYRY